MITPLAHLARRALTIAVGSLVAASALPGVARAHGVAPTPTSWADVLLAWTIEPHVILREVAERGAKAAAPKEAALAHGTRVVARALATVQPGRAVEKTVSLTIQALATAVKAPIAVVKALLIVRTIARELSQERGR